MNKLRTQLILSHLLPMLVIIPLLGLTLIYVLETQVLITSISSGLKDQALLLEQLANDFPTIWNDPSDAEFFIKRVSPLLSARIMLLDTNGHLLASSDPADADHLGQAINVYQYNKIVEGEIVTHESYSQGEVSDLFAPAYITDHQLAGIIRLTHHLSGVYERFAQLRILIVVILAAGLLLGVVAGGALALNVERPLKEVTQAVTRLSMGEQMALIPEMHGPLEIQQLARQVNAFVTRLRSLEQSRKHLLANLVHELGRPLGAMRSAIMALQRGADKNPELQAELLSGMDEEAERLQRLLDDLAHLHDQVLGSLELNRHPTLITEWLHKEIAPWREAAHAKRLRWEEDIPRDLPEMEIDPVRLGQALGNLLSNAVKFTPSGESIGISAGIQLKDGLTETWIEVSDTGPGISLADQEKIFVPLYRGKVGRRFPQGMGLGLSIAHDLIAAHGGYIDLKSKPGFGSHFTIHLPNSHT